MRAVLAVVQVLTVAALTTQADDKKDAPKGIPEHLKGTWHVVDGEYGKGPFFVPIADGTYRLTIGDGKVEWNQILGFPKDDGKATISVQEKETKEKDTREGTLELKIGAKIYRGIYRRVEMDKEVMLTILWGLEGKAAPAAFPDALLSLPKDASFWMDCFLRK